MNTKMIYSKRILSGKVFVDRTNGSVNLEYNDHPCLRKSPQDFSKFAALKILLLERKNRKLTKDLIHLMYLL